MLRVGAEPLEDWLQHANATYNTPHVGGRATRTPRPAAAAGAHIVLADRRSAPTDPNSCFVVRSSVLAPPTAPTPRRDGAAIPADLFRSGPATTFVLRPKSATALKPEHGPPQLLAPCTRETAAGEALDQMLGRLVLDSAAGGRAPWQPLCERIAAHLGPLTPCAPTPPCPASPDTAHPQRAHTHEQMPARAHTHATSTHALHADDLIRIQRTHANAGCARTGRFDSVALSVAAEEMLVRLLHAAVYSEQYPRCISHWASAGVVRPSAPPARLRCDHPWDRARSQRCG